MSYSNPKSAKAENIKTVIFDDKNNKDYMRSTLPWDTYYY